MKKYLEMLGTQQSLTEAEAFACFEELFESEVSDEEIAQLLTALKDKELEPSEISGFVHYLSSQCQSCLLGEEGFFDVCGTGGDGKNSFNISTLTAFVLAAMGEKVAKHGNYSASSIVGSSNLLEALSVPLVDTELKAREILNKTGMVFLHAPLWHPKLKRVSAIRKRLGFRTVFNLLGPLLNPAIPKFQLIGAPDRKLAKLVADVLKTKQDLNFAVVWDHQGYDEISLTGTCSIFRKEDEIEIGCTDFETNNISPEQIEASPSLEEAVIYAKRLLSGLGIPAQEQVVSANAAMALSTKYAERNIKDLYQNALETIRSGKCMQLLNAMRALK